MSSSQPRRTAIEITLFGFLVSLTLKGALDTAYGHSIPGVTSIAELGHALWVPPSLLVGVFLWTLLRFVYGAYRFNDEFQQSSKQLKPVAQFWNVGATFVLFVLFYLTGLSIQHSNPFYIGLIFIHIWDLIWFLVLFTWIERTQSLRTVMKTFVFLDLVTIVALASTLYVFSPDYRGKAAVVMFGLGIIDFVVNRSFFFPTAPRSA